jgi:hypothetical protein
MTLEDRDATHGREKSLWLKTRIQDIAPVKIFGGSWELRTNTSRHFPFWFRLSRSQLLSESQECRWISRLESIQDGS